ncbi:type 4 pilus major pilin [Gluconobacter wancherniae]|uniref:type 4 pilus major pilin n=1 Tax=Gluconobacter wancherniae TaxID=1307955 RepID=UPI001B8C4D0E|nr:type 4 pilus major pilin [Gluconobacter wancherniae]MBS1089939.1 hypothetical protein [Gluconobacter wancherniae]
MQRGITLIESLFVLGIMAILIGGVMAFYSLSNTAMKSNQLISEVAQLIQATQDLNKDRTTFTGMNSQILAKTGLLPSKYINNGSLVTPWGGEIQTIPFNYSDNGPDVYLAFNILNLPKEACIKLGMQDFGGTAQSVTVTNMRVDDTEGLSPVVLVTNCENGDNNYVNIRIMH